MFLHAFPIGLINSCLTIVSVTVSNSGIWFYPFLDSPIIWILLVDEMSVDPDQLASSEAVKFHMDPFDVNIRTKRS